MNQTTSTEPLEPEPQGAPVREYRLHYTEDMMRDAVWTFWRRVLGWKFWLALALLFTGILLKLDTRDLSWSFSIGVAMLVLGVLFGTLLYVVHYRAAMTRLRRMKLPEAVFQAGEESFRLVSDAGTAEMQWRVVTEIWQLPNYWLLFFSKSQFSTLPLSDIDSEGREFILARAKAHGAKIT